MQEPYRWFVLYVRANTEKRVINDLKMFADRHGLADVVDAFSPESEYYYRGRAERKSGETYRKRPLFPGYVFVESKLDAREFLREISAYIYGSHDIIRLLRGSDPYDIALPDDERMRLEFLFRGKRCLEHSVGYIVGDRVDIAAGPLKGQEGLIKYINRHNRYADIEVDMFGGKIKARVALEIVRKTDG